MSSNRPVAIAPDTTVADLLRQYPQLDEPLACLVPAYRALAAPTLRQAVGPMTLHQLATNGAVPLGVLIGGLRAAAGVADAAGETAPGWVTEATTVVTFDARPALASGQHPANTVMSGISELADGGVYEMLTPFVPAPLIEMARARGFDATSIWQDDIVHTYFRRGVRS